jgi:hypothetical protein
VLYPHQGALCNPEIERDNIFYEMYENVRTFTPDPCFSLAYFSVPEPPIARAKVIPELLVVCAYPPPSNPIEVYKVGKMDQ